MEAAPIPFVEGWEFVQTLGEGAYGEVKLAVCQATQECVAVKIIHVTHKAVEENVKKEICILRMMEHKNVIKFYGYRKANEVQYLFLKYASGGELFDRIEPDVGTNLREALRYFHDLIEGVEYLHSRGVCHRDLKPENLLFDENDVLQITDFGMATIFRHQGQERELNRMCGTKPYTAPEVLRGRPYKAEPADIWSCGIILVALLAGELPWDEPTPRNTLYRNWKECQITTNPWNKIDTLALSLCRSVLGENPQRRYTIKQIKTHQFYNKSFPLHADEENALSSPTSPTMPAVKRRMMSRSGEDRGHLSSPSGVVSSSQPERTSNENSMSPMSEESRSFSFSQPTHIDNLFLNSQMQCTPGTSQTPFQKLVKRMTRFFVINTKAETVAELVRVLQKEGYRIKKNHASVLTVFSVHKLIFKIGLIDLGGNLLVDFRLSKGDGIEFKRHFVRIKNKLKHIVRKTAPSWLSASNDARSLNNCTPTTARIPSGSGTKDQDREERIVAALKAGEVDLRPRRKADQEVMQSDVAEKDEKKDSLEPGDKEVVKQDSLEPGDKEVVKQSADSKETPKDRGVRSDRATVKNMKRSTSY
ncbi:serine/threonine-protein kinase Chk1 [Aplysia californica]|uniref:non-specific serine/threonine protein kinase n=1 Tax=Aplysia californica TaxID=6500 RepID=A0ABM0JY90_APLCA|nr:serine/threonine-protein kinase Chk1 [Aplysia californica]